MVLFTTMVYLSYLSYKNNSSYAASLVLDAKTISYAAIPVSQVISQAEITQEDSRVEIVRQFFERYKSPLEPYAKNIVEAADQQGLDFRLIPAIAMQESNVCHKIPKDSYNCWGFGIYGGKVTRFSGYEEAIEIVTKTLAKQYKQNGLETPTEIMSKYTPGSNGSWARGVTHFMESLR